jgi:hypothetical protein
MPAVQYKDRYNAHRTTRRRIKLEAFEAYSESAVLVAVITRGILTMITFLAMGPASQGLGRTV